MVYNSLNRRKNDYAHEKTKRAVCIAKRVMKNAQESASKEKKMIRKQISLLYHSETEVIMDD